MWSEEALICRVSLPLSSSLLPVALAICFVLSLPLRVCAPSMFLRCRCFLLLSSLSLFAPHLCFHLFHSVFRRSSDGGRLLRSHLWRRTSLLSFPFPALLCCPRPPVTVSHTKAMLHGQFKSFLLLVAIEAYASTDDIDVRAGRSAVECAIDEPLAMNREFVIARREN